MRIVHTVRESKQFLNFPIMIKTFYGLFATNRIDSSIFIQDTTALATQGKFYQLCGINMLLFTCWTMVEAKWK